MVSEILLPLPDVAIPPVEGKTLSVDILEVDQSTHLMYVADRTAHGVDVFDVRTPSAKYLTTIPTGADPNGVTVAKNVNKLFVGAADSTVVIIDIDPASMHYDTVIARLSTGGKKRADEMDYDPVDMKLYAANSDDGIVVAVDAVQNKIIKKFTDMGEGLEQPRYNPADQMMYMTSSDQNVLFQFDPKKDVLVKKFPVGVACAPNGLAINPKTGQALLGCSDKQAGHTIVWDLNASKVGATISEVWAGDAVFYSAKDNIFLFAAANRPTGAILGVFTGGPNVRFVGGAPTYVGSHAVAYDETNRVAYTQDQRPNSARLLAFWLSSIPK
jgi:DNA-binding beta-propeller fold protein YncE